MWESELLIRITDLQGIKTFSSNCNLIKCDSLVKFILSYSRFCHVSGLVFHKTSQILLHDLIGKILMFLTEKADYLDFILSSSISNNEKRGTTQIVWFHEKWMVLKSCILFELYLPSCICFRLKGCNRYFEMRCFTI